MQFFATAALIAVASAAAIESRTSSPCGGLTSSPQCCAASVDGILDLDCSARELSPGGFPPSFFPRLVANSDWCSRWPL